VRHDPQDQQQHAMAEVARQQEGLSTAGESAVQVCVMGCSFRASTKTLRGILAFDLAAQGSCRNHRGRTRQCADLIKLAPPMPAPNQVILKCLFRRCRYQRHGLKPRPTGTRQFAGKDPHGRLPLAGRTRSTARAPARLRAAIRAQASLTASTVACRSTAARTNAKVSGDTSVPGMCARN